MPIISILSTGLLVNVCASLFNMWKWSDIVSSGKSFTNMSELQWQDNHNYTFWILLWLTENCKRKHNLYVMYESLVNTS